MVLWPIGVMISSLVSMPPCSMVRCAEEEGGEEGKTALIDQRAVVAGKNRSKNHSKIRSKICSRPVFKLELIFERIFNRFLMILNWGPGHLPLAFSSMVIWSSDSSAGISRVLITKYALPRRVRLILPDESSNSMIAANYNNSVMEKVLLTIKLDARGKRFWGITSSLGDPSAARGSPRSLGWTKSLATTCHLIQKCPTYEFAAARSGTDAICRGTRTARRSLGPVSGTQSIVWGAAAAGRANGKVSRTNANVGCVLASHRPRTEGRHPIQVPRSPTKRAKFREALWQMSLRQKGKL